MILHSDVDQAKLQDAVLASRHKLEPFRQNRYRVVREMAGYNWGGPGAAAARTRPMNLIQLAIGIYATNLVSQNPQSLVLVRTQSLKAFAIQLGEAVNKIIRIMDLQTELHAMAVDAIIGMGIMRIGLEEAGVYTMGERMVDIGKPYAATVDLDDWVHDMGTKKIREAQFYGNMYRVPYQSIMENDRYDEKAKKDIKPLAEKKRYNEAGDERIEEMSREAQRGDDDEYVEMVDLIDIYLPLHNRLMTYEYDTESTLTKRPLEHEPWTGPRGGPYKFLLFDTVPNNSMPIPPAAHMNDVHDAVNIIYNKLISQAKRQKSLNLFRGGEGSKDANRIKDASDGSLVHSTDPRSVQEVKFGGPAQENMAFAIHLKDIFSWSQGNLDLLGGLGPQSETLVQDRMLAQSASKKMTQMQRRTVSCTAEIVRDLAWYLFTDPLVEVPIQVPISGTDRKVPGVYTHNSQVGAFEDYDISIHPYSLKHTTPAERLQMVTNLWQQVIMPGAQLDPMIKPNVEGYIRLAAKYSNAEEDLSDLVKFNSGLVDPSQMGPQQGPGMPPNTTRTNVRVNRPGATEQGKDTAMMQTLMGKPPQDSEFAAIGRPTG